jgi:hypothetical protein
MAVPTFDFKGITTIPQLSIYLVFFLPLTAVVLTVYAIWMWVYRDERSAPKENKDIARTGEWIIG